jgi:hypothetical protein
MSGWMKMLVKLEERTEVQKKAIHICRLLIWRKDKKETGKENLNQ